MTDPDRAATRGFTPLEHTADKSIEAWGATLPDLFVAAAEGMFSEAEDLAAIRAETQWALDLEAASRDVLLRAWLAELLWLGERDELAPCRFQVHSVSGPPWRLSATVHGGPPPADRPHTGAPIKAVTYHQLRVWHDGAGTWRARVVFDV
jgi:SHS2 domain-containing protein